MFKIKVILILKCNRIMESDLYIVKLHYIMIREKRKMCLIMKIDKQPLILTTPLSTLDNCNPQQSTVAFTAQRNHRTRSWCTRTSYPPRKQNRAASTYAPKLQLAKQYTRFSSK